MKKNVKRKKKIIISLFFVVVIAIVTLVVILMNRDVYEPPIYTIEGETIDLKAFNVPTLSEALQQDFAIVSYQEYIAEFELVNIYHYDSQEVSKNELQEYANLLLNQNGFTPEMIEEDTPNYEAILKKLLEDDSVFFVTLVANEEETYVRFSTY